MFSVYVLLLLALAAATSGQVTVGVGSNGNVANVGAGGTGNVAQVAGCTDPALINLCVAGICSCVLPAGGTTDPILKDFTGRKFEFLGDAGSFYSLYSDSAHEINMKLFPGFVDGHNGSYMGDFGVAFHSFRVNVSLLPDGDITVESWEDKAGSGNQAKHTLLASGEATYRIAGQVAGDVLTVRTQPFRPYTGRTVEINTGGLEMGIWSVPAGTVDSLNITQPAYLNFNLTLLAPPAGNVAEGIIGETLQKAADIHVQRAKNMFAESLPSVDPSKPSVFEGKGLTNDYRVSSLFGFDFLFNRFGTKPLAGSVARRAMIASHFAILPFPIESTSMA